MRRPLTTSLLQQPAAAVLASAILFAPALRAQSMTGTVEGTTLAAAGAGVSGVAIALVGTRHHATTDVDGFFRLTYVPAGSYTLRVEPAAGRAFEIVGVLVQGGEVRRVDVDLSTGVPLEEPGGPPPTSPASGAFVSGTDADRLPIADPIDALRFQAGVASGRADALILRGSRPHDQTLFVDGVPVRSLDDGRAPLAAAPNTVSEVSARTGPLGSAWGDAQAGSLSLVTGRSADAWTGALAYESDALQGTVNRSGFQWLEGSVAGRPLANLSVFAGGAATTSQAAEQNRGIQDLPIYAYGPQDTVLLLPTGGPDTVPFVIPQIVQYGGTCDGATADSLVLCYGRRRPRGWESDSRWNARLRYDLGGGAALTVSALTQARQAIDWTATMHEEGRPGLRTSASVLSLDWVQRLVERPGSELTLHATVSRQTERLNRGAVTDFVDLNDATPALARAFDPLDFVVGFETFSTGDPAAHLTRDSTGGYVLTRLASDADWDAAIENVRYHRGTLRPYLGQSDLDPAATYRLNPYGVSAPYPRTGLDFGQTMRDERRTFARAVLDWRTRRYRVHAGVETTRGRVGHWEADWTTLTDGQIYTASPRKTGAFAAFGAEYDFLRLDAGLRLDWFDPGLTLPLVPGRTFTHPAFRADAEQEELTCHASAPQCDASTHIWLESRTHRTLSPSVRAAFPIGRHGSVRLAYAHQVQAPPLTVLAAGANNDVSVAGEGGLFGGDVAPSRTIHYEAGARYVLAGGLTVDAALYYKDLQQQLAYRFVPVFDPVLDSVVSRAIATNADFGDVRGFDLHVAKRWGEWLGGSLAYAYASSRSTGSDATDYVYGLSRLIPPEGVDTVAPPDTPLPTRDQRAHEVSGTLVLQTPTGFASGTILGAVLSDVGAFATFRSGSGLSYTRFANVGDGVRSNWTMLHALRAIEDPRSSRTAWENHLDLRISKGFHVGPAVLEVYGDFRNLLDFANTPIVFAETGDDGNVLHRERLVQTELATLELEGYGVRTTITKTDPDGANPRVVAALDLRNLDAACATSWWWSGGAVTCVILERTERRFGNGDGFYDVEEQEAAIAAWYDSMFSAAHLAGPGRSFRVGVRVGF